MTQALYAHMNNKRKKMEKKQKTNDLFPRTLDKTDHLKEAVLPSRQETQQEQGDYHLISLHSIHRALLTARTMSFSFGCGVGKSLYFMNTPTIDYLPLN
jgi:hypothetical protein